MSHDEQGTLMSIEAADSPQRQNWLADAVIYEI